MRRIQKKTDEIFQRISGKCTSLVGPEEEENDLA